MYSLTLMCHNTGIFQLSSDVTLYMLSLERIICSLIKVFQSDLLGAIIFADLMF